MDLATHPDASVASQPPTRLRQFEDLPGPRGWPVVGNAFQLTPASAHLQMAQWARESNTQVE